MYADLGKIGAGIISEQRHEYKALSYKIIYGKVYGNHNITVTCGTIWNDLIQSQFGYQIGKGQF